MYRRLVRRCIVSVRSVRPGLPALLLLLVAGQPVHAQIELPYYSFGARPYGEETTCDSVYPCGAETAFDELGVYHVEIYAAEYGNPSGLRFTVMMPPEWSVLSYETCNSIVSAGNPLDPALGVEVVADGCWGEDLVDPVLRLTVDCSTPGFLELGPFPGAGEIESRMCNGDWFEVADFYEPRLNIGDFCGRLDTDGPCDFCVAELAGRTTPPSLHVELPPGGAEVHPVILHGDTDSWCSSPPECGSGDYPHSTCFGGLAVPPVSWLEIEHLGSPTDSRHEYEFRFDASGLPAGTYMDRVGILPGSCPKCIETCMDVTLVVHGPASTPETEAVVSGVGLRLRGNPVRDEVDYELVIAERGVVRVDLVAIDGRRVLTLWNGSLGAGVHALTADLGEDGVVAGVYWIRASSHGEFTQQQVIVVPR